MNWKDWGGVELNDKEKVELLDWLLKNNHIHGTSYARTGDTMIIATRDEEGNISVFDCKVRRVAEVRAEELDTYGKVESMKVSHG